MSTLLRINDVSKKTGLAKSTIWAMIKENRFPAQIKLSERVSVWKEDHIEQWIEEVCSENKL